MTFKLSLAPQRVYFQLYPEERKLKEFQEWIGDLNHIRTINEDGSVANTAHVYSCIDTLIDVLEAACPLLLGELVELVRRRSEYNSVDDKDKDRFEELKDELVLEWVGEHNRLISLIECSIFDSAWSIRDEFARWNFDYQRHPQEHQFLLGADKHVSSLFEQAHKIYKDDLQTPTRHQTYKIKLSATT